MDRSSQVRRPSSQPTPPIEALGDLDMDAPTPPSSANPTPARSSLPANGGMPANGSIPASSGMPVSGTPTNGVITQIAPREAEPGDDTPTIISKNHLVSPDSARTAPRDNLANSLRGRKLAHFELIEPIGVGGMAAVIRARDLQLDRFVALKILPPEMAAEEDNIHRFHQEARAAAKLDHENIARVFYCGEDQRLHFIAFEFVEGENLRTILERRGRLPVGEAVRYLLQIATGLEHAASRGVVHRDIKPSNIIITPSGKAKLVDMGLARSLEPHNDQQLTQSGMTLGTFDYISPEQALEPRDADSRSDLYSLGCTFYHMLTGRPPVPEGTAAKKLHHHQHVAPADPRQFNPDIPTEVALIMGRLIAKDPRERYQRPIFLVQHLMQIAQQVGATADLPEGGMIVETPLRTTPRKRPLLFATIAMLVLGLQIVLLTLLNQPESSSVPLPSPVPPRTEKKAPPVKEGMVAIKKTTPAVKDAGPTVVQSEAELERLLSESGPDVTAQLKGVIELGDKGLIYLGDSKRTLLLESFYKEEPATLRFKLPAGADTSSALVGLMIEGGTVTIRNVRFEIEAASTPKFVSAALGVRNSAKVQLQRCEFFQKDVPQRAFIREEIFAKSEQVPVASVLVENDIGTLDSRPVLQIDQCYFHGQPGGQAAVSLNGVVRVDVLNCAFKPHASLFHLRGHQKEYATVLNLNQCSAFVHNGPAFRLDDEARCNLQVKNSIFSGPGEIATRLDEPFLIAQTRKTRKPEPMVRFEGERNLYHAIWDFWRMPHDEGAVLVRSLEEFHREAVAAGGKGEFQSVRQDNASSIWASSAPLKESDPEKTFALRPDVVEVRTPDLKHTLGIQKCSWGEIRQPAYQPKEAIAGVKLAANQRLVDPDDGASNFLVALGQAKSGDEILIKQPRAGREVKLGAFRLDKAGIDLTLRPYPGHHPVLVMDKTSEFDAAFFRLQDGKIQFEDLDILLEHDPEQTTIRSQSVVLLGGSASCTFKNCVITLRPQQDAFKTTRRVTLSVVALLDPEDAMKMAPKSSRQAPEINLMGCFVRGEGDFLSVFKSRPFDLNVDNSLLALSGSLLDVQPAAKEVAVDAPFATIRLSQSAVFQSEAVLSLRAGKSLRALHSHRVDEARGCVFVNLADRTLPLVHIESPDTTREDALRGILDWRGSKNGYANYQRYLVNQPYRDAEPTIRLEQAEWMTYAREAESRFPIKSLVVSAATVRSLWSSTPDMFRSRIELMEDFADLGPTLSPDLILRVAPVKKEPVTPVAP